MSDPRRDPGSPETVKNRRWWIWVVLAVALAIILVLTLGKNLGGGEGPTRVDSAPGTATDAATGTVPVQPGAPMAEGGAAEGGAAPAAGTSAYGAESGVTAPGATPGASVEGASPSQ